MMAYDCWLKRVFGPVGEPIPARAALNLVRGYAVLSYTRKSFR